MRDILKTLIWLMDKGEGLEQKSNDWERAKRKHIDYEHIRKFWERPWEGKKKKERKKKRLKLPLLKGKSKKKKRRMPIKSRKSKRNFNQRKAQQKSIPEKKERLSYKRWLLLSIIKPTMLSDVICWLLLSIIKTFVLLC